MTRVAGNFSVGKLAERLAVLPPSSRFWVGYSGGADSTALLFALSELREQLAAEVRAVHFNHGLQAAASDWESHCRFFCAQRNIPLQVKRLELNAPPGQSFEDQARTRRYAAIEQLLDEDDLYLTAHHADDNAETFLINLMRGSGIEGLAAIPSMRKIGKGWVARPLLEFRRSDLELFLRQRNLPWLEDPSNRDPTFDRNYLRNDVIPALENRWPGMVPRLNQTARHARNFTTVLNGLLTKQYGDLIQDDFTLSLESFMSLEIELQATLIRHWLRDQDIVSPPRQRLQEFLTQINTAVRADNRPEIQWADWLIKRHGRLLWLHRAAYPNLCPERRWVSGSCIDLGADFGQICVSGKAKTLPDGWVIGPRKKEARMILHPGGPRRKLKEIMRQCGLPPWLRTALPVLYWHGEVAAFGDWLFNAEFRSWLSANSAVYTWRPIHPLLRKLQSVSVQSLNRAESSNE